MKSLSVINSNILKIAQLFPLCVTEYLGKDGKPKLGIDFEKLQAELSYEIIAEGEERYQFTWPDKRASVRLANTPTTMTLRPCREESVDFDNTQNLYIEGDNLDVLKVLRETYLGKVKMIYIDPPYRPLSETSSFTSYSVNGFSDKEQIELKDFIEEISKKGAFVLASNSDPKNADLNDEFFDMLYSNFEIKRVFASRMVNSNAKKRGAISELLISNLATVF